MTLSSSEVKRLAKEVGFNACGIARVDRISDKDYPLHRWLAKGYNGDLKYMERNIEKRLDPRLLVPGAKSIICVAKGYNPSQVMKGEGKIARYAYGDDYHDSIKADLYRLASLLGIEAKACVDTVPIVDKYWAVKAGLGWLGRNTLLATPEWGTWVNLGELVTSMEYDVYDSPIDSPCHGCNLCVEACPNHALEVVGQPMIDVRKCIAYQTIECKDEELPEDLNRCDYAFGCDICQLACPYNNPECLKARVVSDFQIRSLERLKDASEDDFNEKIKNSSMNKITYKQWKRNLK